MKPFIFFDLGQTLIDEWSYVTYFDKLLFQTLNDYGARIDQRNYYTLRNDLVRNRKFGSSGFLEIISLMVRLILPQGYDSVIFNVLKTDLLENKRKLVRLFSQVNYLIPLLSEKYSLGIISNNSSGSANLLHKHDLDKHFKIVCLAEDIGFKKPHYKIFQKALLDSNSNVDSCIMVGDRLDIDILPANELGMKTIRTMDSLYKIQEPVNKKETPLFTINSLSELPEVLSRIS